MTKNAVDPLMTISGDLRAVKDPNSPKWPQFYDKYSRYLARVARRKGLPDNKVDDMVAGVMAVLASEMQDFEYDRSKGTFRSFLSTIIGRRIIDQTRAERIRPKPAPQPVETGMHEAGVAEQQADEAVRTIAERALLELAQSVVSMAMKSMRGPSHKFSEKQLQAFELYVVKEMGVADVCERLNLTQQQVYNAKTRIMPAFSKACREAMDEIAPSDTAFRRG